MRKKTILTNQIFNDSDNNKLLIKLPDTSEWSFQECVNNEFLSLGLYLSSHQLDSYSKILSEINIKSSSKILNNPKKYLKKMLSYTIFKIQKNNLLEVDGH